MKRNHSSLTWVAVLLACMWGGCAATPVREIHENTTRVVSEQPVTR